MKTFLQILVAVTVSVTVVMFFAVGQAIKNIEQTIEALDATLVGVQHAMTSSYEESIQESLEHAPKEFTRWQLRGNAQIAAQELLDRLTEKYKLPRHELPTIRWAGLLGNPDAAGEARNCYVDGRGTPKHFPYRGQITLNEILFLRNYEEYMHIIIPHEVAHVFTCLHGGFVYDSDETDWQAEHGPEWERAMRDLGFIDPTKFKTHELDMHPVISYSETLITRIGQALGDDDVQEE